MIKTYKMYLDDVRIPIHDDWVICRSYKEAIHIMLANGCPIEIAFDHDLGLGKNGFHVAKWIIERDMNQHGLFIPMHFKFSCHSNNPDGKDDIISILNNYLIHRIGERNES